MANTIKIKRSAIPGKTPAVSDLSLGELALNTFDGKLYTLKDNGTPSVVELSGGGGGGGGGGNSYTQSATAPGGASTGDLWLDVTTGVLYIYTGDDDGAQWVEFGGNAGPSIVTQTQQVIQTSITFSTGFNGLSVGPVEIAPGYSVTVPANATWMVL